MNALKSVTDPSGAKILDNTIIQFGNGLFDGNHNLDGQSDSLGLPTVLAGGKNMINPGRFIALPSNTDTADLHYTINTKLGMGLPNFAGSTKVVAL